MRNNVFLSFPRKLVLKLIRFYQRFISPMMGDVCRFRPSCSEYTFQAIEKYGLVRGALKGTWRICRCNPFTKGGDDPLK